MAKKIEHILLAVSIAANLWFGYIIIDSGVTIMHLGQRVSLQEGQIEALLVALRLKEVKIPVSALSKAASAGGLDTFTKGEDLVINRVLFKTEGPYVGQIATD